MFPVIFRSVSGPIFVSKNSQDGGRMFPQYHPVHPPQHPNNQLSHEMKVTGLFACSFLLGRGMSMLGIQSPLLGVFCMLLAGSLWHKGAYNRSFPCMEANYPYAIKNQRGARITPSKRYFCDQLVLYGIRLLA